MKKEKRGISNLATIILIVAISIVALLLAFNLPSIIRTYGKSSEQNVNCLTDADITILNSCYKDNILNPTNSTLNLTIKNNKDIKLGNFFLIAVYYQDGNSELIPTPPFTSLAGLESKKFSLSYSGGKINKIKVMPRIEQAELLCAQVAPEASPGEC